MDKHARNAYKNAWYKANSKRLAEKRKQRFLTDPAYAESERKASREWAKRNPERARTASGLHGYAERERLKNAVFNVLTNGEGTCRWCGQGDQDVLCVDHIADDGAKHRETIGGKSIYRWLVQNDYPAGFQVLCYNCNRKKQALFLRKNRTYART